MPFNLLFSHTAQGPRLTVKAQGCGNLKVSIANPPQQPAVYDFAGCLDGVVMDCSHLPLLSSISSLNVTGSNGGAGVPYNLTPQLEKLRQSCPATP